MKNFYFILSFVLFSFLLFPSLYCQDYFFITQWGKLGTGDGEFNEPAMIYLYHDSLLYVSDTRNNRIQVFDKDGNFNQKYEPSGNVNFYWPFGIAFDSVDNMYVTGGMDYAVQKFDKNLKLLNTWNSGFTTPTGIVIDKNGYIFISESNGQRVKKFNSSMSLITSWGGSGSSHGQFYYPYSIGLDSNNHILVSDLQNARVQIFDMDGKYISSFGKSGSGKGEFAYPFGIAVNNKNNLFIVQENNNRVIKFDKNYQFLTEWGKYGTNESEFQNPRGIAVDKDGFVYVCDARNNRIQKFGPVSPCDETAFNYDDFQDDKNLTFPGNTINYHDFVRLTSNGRFQKGAMWYAKQVPVRNGFTTTFKFRLSEGRNNESPDGSLPGADGIAFVIQNSSKYAIGNPGLGIGYDGIPNSLAIEIDTYYNDNYAADPDGNHLAVQTMGTLPNSANHSSAALRGITSNIITLRSDSTEYFCKINYNKKPNTLEIYLDSTGQFSSPSFVLPNIYLDKLLNLDQGEGAYVGLTSATGDAWENNDILSWDFCPVKSDFISGIHDQFFSDEKDGITNINPNPANGITEIEYNLSKAGNVIISLWNMKGINVSNILNRFVSSGNNKVYFNTEDLPTDVYFMKMQTNNSIITKKVIILK